MLFLYISHLFQQIFQDSLTFNHSYFLIITIEKCKLENIYFVVVFPQVILYLMSLTDLTLFISSDISIGFTSCEMILCFSLSLFFFTFLAGLIYLFIFLTHALKHSDITGNNHRCQHTSATIAFENSSAYQRSYIHGPIVLEASHSRQQGRCNFSLRTLRIMIFDLAVSESESCLVVSDSLRTIYSPQNSVKQNLLYIV